MVDFMDHASLIVALGGAARVAEAPEVSTLPVNVRAWVSRNRIPPEHWPGVIGFATRMSLSVDADWLMRATPPRASTSQAAA